MRDRHRFYTDGSANRASKDHDLCCQILQPRDRLLDVAPIMQPRSFCSGPADSLSQADERRVPAMSAALPAIGHSLPRATSGLSRCKKIEIATAAR